MEHLRLLSAREVAAWLSVSPSWVFDHASGRRRPLLPAVKVGKFLRFKEQAVSEWIEAMSRRRAA